VLFKKKKLGNELELSYALPESMLRDMPKDTPHVFVNSDRQLVSMCEMCKFTPLRLCISVKNGNLRNHEQGFSREDTAVDGKGNVKKGDKIDLPYIKYKYTQARIYGRRVSISPSKRGTVQLVAKHNYANLRINLSYGSRNLFTLATSLSVLMWIYLLFSRPIAFVLDKLKRKDEPDIEVVS